MQNAKCKRDIQYSQINLCLDSVSDAEFTGFQFKTVVIIGMVRSWFLVVICSLNPYWHAKQKLYDKCRKFAMRLHSSVIIEFSYEPMILIYNAALGVAVCDVMCLY